MTTGLFTHPACLAHETPPGHPERADRLRREGQGRVGAGGPQPNPPHEAGRETQ